MKMTVIAIGKQMPSWVYQAVNDYCKRFPKPFSLDFIEINMIPGQQTLSAELIQKKEREKIEAVLEDKCLLIALDQKGKTFTSESLAKELVQLRLQARPINFIIGGAYGLAPELIQRAYKVMSLSSLTFAHPLVRVILAEQLYRAWSILAGHPYHK